MTFAFATWNVLATAYIRPRFYPYTPASCLDPAWRVPELVRHARLLDAGILCCQEVEADVFQQLESGLAAPGYAGTHALKTGQKPDGCATFFRTNIFSLVSSRRIAYDDAGPEASNSGHIALLDVLRHESRTLQVLNTHLKWDAPGCARERQWGYRQAMQAIRSFDAQPSAGNAQIICGDLNVTPASEVVDALLDAGFDYTHRQCAGALTCNSNREAKLIDYIFFRGPVRALAVCPPEITATTPLPSPDSRRTTCLCWRTSSGGKMPREPLKSLA